MGLIRYVRSGSVSGTLEVTNIPTSWSAAVSSAASSSLAAELAGTASIDVSGFSPLEFASLHILTGSLGGEFERLSGSFVSGNIFGGDRLNYSTQSVVLYGHVSQSIVYTEEFISVMTASATRLAPFFAEGTGGVAPAAVPTEGQIFPRGVCS